MTSIYGRFRQSGAPPRRTASFRAMAVRMQVPLKPSHSTAPYKGVLSSDIPLVEPKEELQWKLPVGYLELEDGHVSSFWALL